MGCNCSKGRKGTAKQQQAVKTDGSKGGLKLSSTKSSNSKESKLAMLKRIWNESKNA